MDEAEDVKNGLVAEYMRHNEDQEEMEGLVKYMDEKE